MDLTPWAWLILPLGVCRATQIVLWDRITERPRAALLARWNPDGLDMKDPARSYRSYLLECPWCMSVWLGIVAVVLTVADPTRPYVLAVLAGLALSLLAVVLDRMVDRWFPDEPTPAPAPPPTQAAVPPHVAAAFDQHTGDRADGSG